jgi:hypothetical protein
MWPWEVLPHFINHATHEDVIQTEFLKLMDRKKVRANLQ